MQNCESCDPCQDKVIPVHQPVIQQNTDDVFFSVCSTDKLDNLNLQSGTDLTAILKKIDYKLGDNFNTTNFNSFNLLYLKSKYFTNTVKTFSESVNLELEFDNTRITNVLSSINQSSNAALALTNVVESIRIPAVIDSSGLGFTVSDTINTVLQKVVNKFNNIVSGQTNLSSSDSTSIKINLSGNNNSSIKASVKVSSAPNNKLQVFNDGLYVTQSAVVASQSLSINNNQLTISDGNTVSLPISGFQTLQRVGNVIRISNGNEITLPTTAETSLVTNSSSSILLSNTGATGHNLTANVKLSSISGNKITVNSDGLYVQSSALDVLTEINNSPSLKSSLCTMISSCNNSTCYSWFIQNNSTSSIVINYLNTNDVSQSLSLAGSSSSTLSGTKVLTNPTNSLIITFQGKC